MPHENSVCEAVVDLLQAQSTDKSGVKSSDKEVCHCYLPKGVINYGLIMMLM